jgi:hypothetical protein
MKKLFLKTALLLFAITFFNCENNTNTNGSTGNDSFSCYINGKLYIPSAGTGIGGGDIRPFSWAFKERNNEMRLTFYAGGEYTLFINLLKPLIGDNKLNEELNDAIDTSHNGMVLHNNLIFYNTKNNTDNIIIKISQLSEKEVIGSFEGILYNDKGVELNITKGNFNLSLDSKRN